MSNRDRECPGDVSRPPASSCLLRCVSSSSSSPFRRSPSSPKFPVETSLSQDRPIEEPQESQDGFSCSLVGTERKTTAASSDRAFRTRELLRQIFASSSSSSSSSTHSRSCRLIPFKPSSSSTPGEPSSSSSSSHFSAPPCTSSPLVSANSRSLGRQGGEEERAFFPSDSKSYSSFPASESLGITSPSTPVAARTSGDALRALHEHLLGIESETEKNEREVTGTPQSLYSAWRRNRRGKTDVFSLVSVRHHVDKEGRRRREENCGPLSRRRESGGEQSKKTVAESRCSESGERVRLLEEENSALSEPVDVSFLFPSLSPCPPYSPPSGSDQSGCIPSSSSSLSLSPSPSFPTAVSFPRLASSSFSSSSSSNSSPACSPPSIFAPLSSASSSSPPSNVCTASSNKKKNASLLSDFSSSSQSFIFPKTRADGLTKREKEQEEAEIPDKETAEERRRGALVSLHEEGSFGGQNSMYRFSSLSGKVGGVGGDRRAGGGGGGSLSLPLPALPASAVAPLVAIRSRSGGGGGAAGSINKEEGSRPKDEVPLVTTSFSPREMDDQSSRDENKRIETKTREEGKEEETGRTRSPVSSCRKKRVKFTGDRKILNPGCTEKALFSVLGEWPVLNAEMLKEVLKTQRLEEHESESKDRRGRQRRRECREEEEEKAKEIEEDRGGEEEQEEEDISFFEDASFLHFTPPSKFLKERLGLMSCSEGEEETSEIDQEEIGEEEKEERGEGDEKEEDEDRKDSSRMKKEEDDMEMLEEKGKKSDLRKGVTVTLEEKEEKEKDEKSYDGDEDESEGKSSDGEASSGQSQGEEEEESDGDASSAEEEEKEDEELKSIQELDGLVSRLVLKHRSTVRSLRQSFMSSYSPLSSSAFSSPPPCSSSSSSGKRHDLSPFSSSSVLNSGLQSPPSSPCSDARELFALMLTARAAAARVRLKFGLYSENPLPGALSGPLHSASSPTSTLTTRSSPIHNSPCLTPQGPVSPPLPSLSPSSVTGVTGGRREEVRSNSCSREEQRGGEASLAVPVSHGDRSACIQFPYPQKQWECVLRHINEGFSDVALWLVGSAHSDAWREGLSRQLEIECRRRRAQKEKEERRRILRQERNETDEKKNEEKEEDEETRTTTPQEGRRLEEEEDKGVEREIVVGERKMIIRKRKKFEGNPQQGPRSGESEVKRESEDEHEELKAKKEEQLAALKDTYIQTVRCLQRLDADELIEGSFIIDRVVGPQEVHRTVAFGRHGRRAFLQALDRPGVVVRGWVVRCDSDRDLLLVRLVAAEIYPLSSSASPTSQHPSPSLSFHSPSASPSASPRGGGESPAATITPVRRRLLRAECDIGSSGVYAALPLGAIGRYESRCGQASGCIGRFLPVGTAVRACIADLTPFFFLPPSSSPSPAAVRKAEKEEGDSSARSGRTGEVFLDETTLNEAHAHLVLTLKPPPYLTAADAKVPLQKPLGFLGFQWHDSLSMRCGVEDYLPISSLQPPSLESLSVSLSPSSLPYSSSREGGRKAEEEEENNTSASRPSDSSCLSTDKLSSVCRWWDGGSSLLHERFPFILTGDARVKNAASRRFKLEALDLLRSRFFSFSLSCGMFSVSRFLRKVGMEAERITLARREEEDKWKKEEEARREKMMKMTTTGESTEAAEMKKKERERKKDQKNEDKKEEDQKHGLGKYLSEEQSGQWAQQRLHQGVGAARKGDLKTAMECYESALLLKPQYTDALVARGAAHANKLEYEKALEDLNAALDQEPQHPNALKYLRIVIQRMQNEEKLQSAPTQTTPVTPVAAASAAVSSSSSLPLSTSLPGMNSASHTSSGNPLTTMMLNTPHGNLARAGRTALNSLALPLSRNLPSDTKAVLAQNALLNAMAASALAEKQSHVYLKRQRDQQALMRQQLAHAFELEQRAKERKEQAGAAAGVGGKKSGWDSSSSSSFSSSSSSSSSSGEKRERSSSHRDGGGHSGSYSSRDKKKRK